MRLSDGSVQLSFTPLKLALFALKNIDLSGKQLAFIMQHSAGWCIAVKALLADPELINLKAWQNTLLTTLTANCLASSPSKSMSFGCCWPIYKACLTPV